VATLASGTRDSERVAVSPSGNLLACADGAGEAYFAAGRLNAQRANSVARDSRTTVTRIWPG
jgi:hypothetical protein